MAVTVAAVIQPMEDKNSSKHLLLHVCR